MQKKDSSFRGEKIHLYRNLLKPIYPKFCKLEVKLPRFGFTILPWENWRTNKTPLWWRAYNNVKHNRDKHYKSANLRNVIASLTGLFIANLYFYKNKAENEELMPNPRMFSLLGDSYRILDNNEHYILE